MQDYSGYGGDFGSTSPLPPMPPRPPRRRIGLLSYVGVALAAGALGAGTVVALYHPAANSPVSAQPSRAAGTGMVINAGSGLVLTNNHVIENATKITATVAATGQKFLAKVVGYDVT